MNDEVNIYKRDKFCYFFKIFPRYCQFNRPNRLKSHRDAYVFHGFWNNAILSDIWYRTFYHIHKLASSLRYDASYGFGSWYVIAISFGTLHTATKHLSEMVNTILN